MLVSKWCAELTQLTESSKTEPQAEYAAFNPDIVQHVAFNPIPAGFRKFLVLEE